jgi:orotate phosphoribosyltransferase
MNIDTTRQEVEATAEWSQVAGRLGAIVNFTSRWAARYPSVDFDSPYVLNFERMLGPTAIKFHSRSGEDLSLEVQSGRLTIEAALDPPACAGKLIFWAILDPDDTDNSTNGLMVGRTHGMRVVGKTTQAGGFKLTRRALCILSTADLNGVGDRDLLSFLGRGLSEAAADADRDAWVSWLWSHVSQGLIGPSYAKKLGAKVLGPLARRFTASTSAVNSTDVVKSLSSIGVFERGADYVLPSGLHAAAHVNLGIACGHPAMVRELAERVKEKLGENSYDAIVSTGWPVAMIAREVVRLRPMTAAGVVRHCEYEGVQALPVAPVSEGSRVVILTDVIVTGQLVKRVAEVVEAGGASVAGVVAIVDGRDARPGSEDLKFKAICQYDVQAVAQESCPRCGHLERREFNPVASCMTSKKREPRSPNEFLDENREAADFWKQVDMARAYEHHRLEGHTHYISFIDTVRLLTHETIGPTIASKLIARIPKLIGAPDVLLFPAKARSRLLAGMLLRGIKRNGRLWPPSLVAARQVEGRFRLRPEDRQTLKDARVLLVDTGLSSGSTLEELHSLATRAGASLVAAVVIVSRVSENQEAAIANCFEGRFWRLYQLPIRPLSIPDALRHLCPVCSRRAEISEAASQSRFEPIVALSREICSRRSHRPSVTAAAKRPMNRDRQLDLVAQTEVPLLERCRRSTASGVILHSLYAARNDGMAPLRLPEICDNKIPAANRSAMLEYLGSSAWKWSRDSLLPDAKRLLDERDPDEIWAACAGLLNRGACHYWIEALQRRLEVSEFARHQQSKAIWNRLAFEVYWLLKKEPSSLSELSQRFEAMHRACLKTPVEAGIAPILEIIQELGNDLRV